MKFIFSCWLLFFSLRSNSQTSDTLNGFREKINGEEINYFSHLHQFAKTALLTRVNGEMPISWESPVYNGNKELVTYEFLLGHSTGTSSGDRHFYFFLNEKKIFTLTTPMHKNDKYSISGIGENNIIYHFIHEEYDANGDAFGKFFITVPSGLVNKKASFTVNGQNENSRDWLMIFMYQKGLKLIAQPTNLVTRKENKRQLNVFVDNPYPANTSLLVKTAGGEFQSLLQTGYNKLQFSAYETNFTGDDKVQFIINQKDEVEKTVSLMPLKNYVFCIIHHSHNDIGYSNLQTEVEQIQNRNIRTAIRWANNNQRSKEKPVWHIESLWAVENFLRTTKEEEKQFVQAVKNGNLVLSANYANILTGLCQPEELNWMIEYAKQLEKKYSFHISNAMITDIPGISRSGLLAYVNNGISYLSLGPNYVESLPDKGDRVGGVMNEQGDKIFYWKPDLHSDKKLLVWTAGKGYSFFHGITDSEKQQSWEKRISDYCIELMEKNYPYDLVQLRYTKNSDNGPVDTMLTSFVENWNQRYSTPQLRISSVDQFFNQFEKKYGKNIPVMTGEISPYWEDGAYSTAIEEMENRQLVLKTLAMEKFARSKNQFNNIRPTLYLLHKNIVLFHEHTWGAWCSISDPQNSFTTEQWRIKKQFVDSASYYYEQLASQLHFKYEPDKPVSNGNLIVTDFTVDKLHGGLASIMVNGKNIVTDKGPYYFFEPVYALGINPTEKQQSQQVEVTEIENSQLKKIVEIKANLPSMQQYRVDYTLYKKEGRIVCRFRFEKTIEKNKESLHIAFPFGFSKPVIEYGNSNNKLRYNIDQLAGSNKDFVCVEKEISVQENQLVATISSPLFALYEIGDIINEDKTNGVKTWKKENNNTASLFLYILNNYWHTNYKAYQQGHFDFEIGLRFKNKN
jgi:alpha-mannosidase